MATPLEQAEEIKAGVEDLQDDVNAIADKPEDPLARFLDSDIVTSETTEFDDTISTLRERIEKGSEASKTVIEEQSERERLSIEESGAEELTAAREQARGLGAASSFALIQRIEESTEKSLRDLESRKREALAANDAQSFNKLLNLELRTLEFKENAKQQAFQNALSILGVDLQKRGLSIQEQRFDMEKMRETIDLLTENDLLDSLGEDQKRLFESQFGLKPGAFDQIKPKKDEQLLFTATNPNGDVTAIYLDKKTGKRTQEVYKGIGKPMAGDGGIKITPEDKRTLIGVGFNEGEVSQIESDVARFGLERTIKGVTDDVQKEAIRQVYGLEERATKEGVKIAVFQMDEDEFKGTLQAKFSDEDLQKKAREDSKFRVLFKGQEGEVAKFLDSREARDYYSELLFEELKEAGLAK